MSEKHVQEMISARIEGLLEERGWSVYRLARESRLAESSLYPIVHGHRDPRVVILAQICTGLEVTLGEFFAPTLPEDLHLDLQEQSLIRLLRSLSETERSYLSAYLDGLAGGGPGWDDPFSFQ